MVFRYALGLRFPPCLFFNENNLIVVTYTLKTVLFEPFLCVQSGTVEYLTSLCNWSPELCLAKPQLYPHDTLTAVPAPPPAAGHQHATSCCRELDDSDCST